MKWIKEKAFMAMVCGAGLMMGGCSLDAPFGDGGEGSLSITTEMNGDVTPTRAVPADNDYLRQNCMVYIENARGVMRKYKGVDNIPQSINLKVGNYVCNAWAGDSLPASYTAKFYRGQQNFEITTGQNTSLLMKCNIANVVVSVDPGSLNVGLTDMKVTFNTSRGSLAFDESTIPDGKGYFMTPSPEVKGKDPEAYAKNTTLTIVIEGKKSDGTPYSKTEVVKDIKRAHEYALLVTKEDRPVGEGGALISIVIKDIPIIEDTVEVFEAPVVRGVGFNVEDQVISTDSQFKDTKVYVRGYFGLSSLIMTPSANFSGLETGVNILDATVRESLSSKGILVERTEATDAETGVKVDEVYITFRASYLNSLAASDTEYSVGFEATDGRHFTGKGTLHIANTDKAITHIDDVVTEPQPSREESPMAVLAREATLTGVLYNPAAASYGFRYRVAGTAEWQTAVATPAAGKRHRAATRAEGVRYSVKITGLQPATNYEYKAFADDFEAKNVYTFTTESPYVLPNASFEEWGTYSAKTMLGTKTVIFPGTGSEPTFWDSGNEGAATASKVVTDKSSDMAHSGTYSARLASTSALGVLAAGNIFIGDYVKTDGTNGVLSEGRSYNGSHPSKVRVWANYRPGVVDIIMKGNEGFLDFAKGDNDHGQIYIAITDEPIEIRTNPSNQKLFDKNDPHVLAYGELTWREAFGPDGQLQMAEIPFTYYDRARTTPARYIVIVSCASKFGDFFSGSSKSVMYLDDFELVYE